MTVDTPTTAQGCTDPSGSVQPFAREDNRKPHRLRRNMTEQILQYHTEHPDWSHRKIAELLDVHHSHVSRIIKREKETQKAAPPPVTSDLPVQQPSAIAQPKPGRRRTEKRERIIACAAANPAWNQHQIAQELGVSQSWVNEVLNAERAGKPSEEQIMQMAATLPEGYRVALEKAAAKRSWTEEMLKQAIANVLHPNVPQQHKEFLLEGTGDPIVYGKNGDVKGIMNRMMGPAHPEYADIMRTMSQLDAALGELLAYDATFVASALPPNGILAWKRLHEVQIPAMLAYVEEVIRRSNIKLAPVM